MYKIRDSWNNVDFLSQCWCPFCTAHFIWNFNADNLFLRFRLPYKSDITVTIALLSNTRIVQREMESNLCHEFKISKNCMRQHRFTTEEANIFLVDLDKGDIHNSKLILACNTDLNSKSLWQDIRKTNQLAATKVTGAGGGGGGGGGFINTWMSNHMPGVWDEIIYPFPNSKSSTFKAWNRWVISSHTLQ